MRRNNGTAGVRRTSSSEPSSWRDRSVSCSIARELSHVLKITTDSLKTLHVRHATPSVACLLGLPAHRVGTGAVAGARGQGSYAPLPAVHLYHSRGFERHGRWQVPSAGWRTYTTPHIHVRSRSGRCSVADRGALWRHRARWRCR